MWWWWSNGLDRCFKNPQQSCDRVSELLGLPISPRIHIIPYNKNYHLMAETVAWVGRRLVPLSEKSHGNCNEKIVTIH